MCNNLLPIEHTSRYICETTVDSEKNEKQRGEKLCQEYRDTVMVT